jgi:hypothetical protein
VALAREVDPREVLVEADGDVGIGLVVPQPDVEARLVLLDEGLLVSSASCSLATTRYSMWSMKPIIVPRALKWEATRLRMDFALPT